MKVANEVVPPLPGDPPRKNKYVPPKDAGQNI
jgi:hypothetical protein